MCSLGLLSVQPVLLALLSVLVPRARGSLLALELRLVALVALQVKRVFLVSVQVSAVFALVTFPR